ncbi:hypothetical protein BH20VER1_BH20VER1_14030 [soil metagenome]
MKTNIHTHYPSTYELLVSSEEKERGLSETLITALLIGSAVFSIWHAAAQPVTPLPVNAARFGPAFAQSAEVQQSRA